jgi:tRNA 5-methylaminomethyl-2-thiouridine biosynthesis bifunctional protein
MPSNKHLSDVSPARIRWQENGYPYSLDYEDVYYSEGLALEESTHVFLEANKLAERWQKIESEDFTIAELGFGAGINFLNCCRLWCNTAPETSRLHYLASELHPFQSDDLKRLLKLFPELDKFSPALLDNMPALCPGIHQREFSFGKYRVTLNLLYGDAREQLRRIMQKNGFRVDCWFLDGFSPAKNPELWQKDLCQTVAALSKTDCSLSTYSAAATIKHALHESRFTVQRVKGFGRKRHMLKAVFQGILAHEAYKTDCYTLPSRIKSKTKTALIIGAGLAGCSTAHALAKAGWQPTVIERQRSIAGGASGNNRGVVSCRVSLEPAVTDNFYLQAFLYAMNHYRQLSESASLDWSSSGHLHLALDEQQQKRQQKLHASPCLKELTRLLDAHAASQVSGITLQQGGLYFPQSVSLNPQALCQAYLKDPNIKVQLEQEALELAYQDHAWQVMGSSGPIASAPILIIANSHDALSFTQTCHYPLLKNFGQLDEYARPAAAELKCIISGRGYLLPHHEHKLLVGGLNMATDYEYMSVDKGIKENLNLLQEISPDLVEELQSERPLNSRGGIRCSSPDYLPLLGPVEHYQNCQERYSDLSRNARGTNTEEAILQPGLFINLAHGSHALSSTPLSAAYLAGIITGSPLPLTRQMVAALHPIRFLIRNLKRQKDLAT